MHLGPLTHLPMVAAAAAEALLPQGIQLGHELALEAALFFVFGRGFPVANRRSKAARASSSEGPLACGMHVCQMHTSTLWHFSWVVSHGLVDRHIHLLLKMHDAQSYQGLAEGRSAAQANESNRVALARTRAFAGQHKPVKTREACTSPWELSHCSGYHKLEHDEV